MSEKQSLDREARSAALAPDRALRRLLVISAGFVASMGFGIILIASGDWIPGGIIVAAALVGLAVQIPGLRQLHRERSGPSPPRSSVH